LLVVACSARGAAAAEPSANTTWRAEWLTAHDDVVLMSAGVVRLEIDDSHSIDAFHVRLNLSARDRTTGDITAASLGTLRPIAANASVPAIPSVSIDAGNTEMVELYFPLPGRTTTFSWTLSTRGAPVTLRARLRPDATAAQGDDELGAQHWWFSRAYSWPTFRHSDGVITSRPPKTAIVRRVAGEFLIQKIAECDQW
jgi:hypothetical protein